MRPKEVRTRSDLFGFCCDKCLELLRRYAGGNEIPPMGNHHTAFAHRTQCVLPMMWASHLAHDQDVEWCTQHPGNFRGHGNATAGKTKHHGIC